MLHEHASLWAELLIDADGFASTVTTAWPAAAQRKACGTAFRRCISGSPPPTCAGDTGHGGFLVSVGSTRGAPRGCHVSHKLPRHVAYPTAAAGLGTGRGGGGGGGGGGTHGRHSARHSSVSRSICSVTSSSPLFARRKRNAVSSDKWPSWSARTVRIIAKLTSGRPGTYVHSTQAKPSQSQSQAKPSQAYAERSPHRHGTAVTQPPTARVGPPALR